MGWFAGLGPNVPSWFGSWAEVLPGMTLDFHGFVLRPLAIKRLSVRRARRMMAGIRSAMRPIARMRAPLSKPPIASHRWSGSASLRSYVARMSER